jgi:hypothetical protein
MFATAVDAKSRRAFRSVYAFASLKLRRTPRKRMGAKPNRVAVPFCPQLIDLAVLRSACTGHGRARAARSRGSATSKLEADCHCRYGHYMVHAHYIGQDFR